MTDDQEMTSGELESKVAVITGASSGIGQATALEFASQGYHVVLTARREKLLDEVAEKCERHGVKALAVAADTTDEAGLQRVADSAIGMFGHIDVWVNDAAVSVYAKFLDTPVKDFRRVLDTNVMGYVHGARCALQQFREQGYGVLINISSINAVAPVPYSSAYVTSKYAVRGLSESIRMELEVEGLADTIHICTVMPASTDTNFFQNAANYMNREARAVEPVYDPSYVAKHIVRLADMPKDEITIGPAGKLMALEHLTMPKIYSRTMARFVNLNNFGRKPADATSGSLYDSIEANRGVRGGWREKRINADKLNVALGGAAAIIVGLIGVGYIASKKH